LTFTIRVKVFSDRVDMVDVFVGVQEEHHWVKNPTENFHMTKAVGFAFGKLANVDETGHYGDGICRGRLTGECFLWGDPNVRFPSDGAVYSGYGGRRLKRFLSQQLWCAKC
jgi:hypothetical protein